MFTTWFVVFEATKVSSSSHWNKELTIKFHPFSYKKSCNSAHPHAPSEYFTRGCTGTGPPSPAINSTSSDQLPWHSMMYGQLRMIVVDPILQATASLGAKLEMWNWELWGVEISDHLPQPLKILSLPCKQANKSRPNSKKGQDIIWGIYCKKSRMWDKLL